MNFTAGFCNYFVLLKGIVMVNVVPICSSLSRSYCEIRGPHFTLCNILSKQDGCRYTPVLFYARLAHKNIVLIVELPIECHTLSRQKLFEIIPQAIKLFW